MIFVYMYFYMFGLICCCKVFSVIYVLIYFVYMYDYIKFENILIILIKWVINWVKFKKLVWNY